MARLVGVDLPRDKRIEVGLTYIYGIGLTTSKKILAETGVDPSVRVKDLTEDDLTKLRDYIQANIKVEGDLQDVYKRQVYAREQQLVAVAPFHRFVEDVLVVGFCADDVRGVEAEEIPRNHAIASKYITFANTLLRQYTFYGRLRERSVHERRSGRSGRADGGEKEHDTTRKTRHYQTVRPA